jgi:tetratricopeptide (TPR) repeat protein
VEQKHKSYYNKKPFLMVRRLFLIAVFLCAALWSVLAQSPGQDVKKQVRDLLAQGKYAEAKTLIVGSRELPRDDKEGRFLLAVTNYHLNLHEEALTQLRALGYSDRYPFPECRLYLAKILHVRHEFAEAAQQYKKYLKTLPDSNPYRRAVWNEVRRCQNGLDLQFKTPQAFVENLGADINSAGDEFGPVPSSITIDRLFFTSIRQGNTGERRDASGNPNSQEGKYMADMYSSRLSAGKWSQVQPMAYHLNTNRHEVVADLNSLGNVLVFFRGNSLYKGELLVDTFRQSAVGMPNPSTFAVPFNPAEGEVSFHWFSDSLILFASNQRGGLGGYDLFKSVFVNGSWTTPENLGAPINSAFDEISPFLLRDGRTLFFSSNNTEGSIGGMDIFKSRWNGGSERWEKPQNLGLPVNSASDETHFRLSRDRFSAFFASNRQGGFGQRDIYAAYFNEILEQEPELELANNPQAPATNTNPPPVKVQVPLIPSNTLAEAPNPAEAKTTRPLESPAVLPLQDYPVVDTPAAVTPAQKAMEPLPEPAEFGVVGKTAPTQPTPASVPALVSQPISDSSPRAVRTATVWKSADQFAVNPGLFEDEIESLTALMKRESDWKVVLTVFIKKDNIPGVSLFSGMRTAESVIAKLESRGISPERMFCRAVQAEWNNAEAGKHLLTFTWVPAPGRTSSSPSTGLAAEFPEIDFNENIEAPLLFKVQISSLKGENKNMNPTKYPNPMVEKSYGVDYYRYTAGAFTSWTAAEEFRKRLASQGISGAYITTYIYGFRMERNEARFYLSTFPELQRFYNR